MCRLAVRCASAARFSRSARLSVGVSEADRPAGSLSSDTWTTCLTFVTADGLMYAYGRTKRLPDRRGKLRRRTLRRPQDVIVHAGAADAGRPTPRHLRQKRNPGQRSRLDEWLKSQLYERKKLQP